MAFNFPDAPAEDQVFTPSGGPTYVYKAPRWLVQMAPAAAGVTTDDAAPSSPVDGQLWYKSNTGDTYIWYVDPSGVPGQWVQVNVMPATGSSPVATAQTRNRVVNGAMQISQENGDTNSFTTGYYPADQWTYTYVSSSGAAAIACQRYGLFTSPSGTKYRIITVAGTIDTSIAASELWIVYQQIEGIRVVDFGWGTAAARQVVLRFGVRCPIAGTFGGSLRNGAADRSYSFSYTISAGEVNTDVYRTIVIPGDTTGTWPTDTSKSITLTFAFMSGTTYSAAANAWSAGNFIAPTGITNGAAQTGQFHLFDVGLYCDPQNTGVAPAWQMPDEAEELRACQRYWYKAAQPVGTIGYFYGTAGATTMTAGFIPFPVPMRSTVTTATLTAPTMTNCSAHEVAASTTEGAYTRVTVTAAGIYRAINGVYSFSSRM